MPYVRTTITPKTIKYLESLPDTLFDNRPALLNRMLLDGHRRAAEELQAMDLSEYHDFVVNTLGDPEES
jgi:hypothetical protein